MSDLIIIKVNEQKHFPPNISIFSAIDCDYIFDSFYGPVKYDPGAQNKNQGCIKNFKKKTNLFLNDYHMVSHTLLEC